MGKLAEEVLVFKWRDHNRQFSVETISTKTRREHYLVKAERGLPGPGSPLRGIYDLWITRCGDGKPQLPESVHSDRREHMRRAREPLS